jgi:hypothetical protein
MNTLTELLPSRKSSKRSTINWRPVEDNEFSQVAGVLTIHTDRASAAYVVEEFSTGWTGRGFVLKKAAGGTDMENEQYTVYCNPARPAATSCCCKGHQRHLTCKHADSVVALIQYGWL